MREYSDTITLTKNSRGIYSLDPSFGCSSGLKNNKLGCYNDCYAARYSKKYGYDFSKTKLRYFKNESHKHQIINKIAKIPMPFLRMGTSGDPSESWEHTLNIIETINKDYQLSIFPIKKKPIVIITKHWKNLNNNQLKILSKYDICINTSVSALDDFDVLTNSLIQYKKLKKYCKSILRIVSFDFNLENIESYKYFLIQKKLFANDNVLDTIFRCSPKNKYVKDGIINIKKTKFLGKKCYVSKYKKKTYFGKCTTCLEMCGNKM